MSKHHDQDQRQPQSPLLSIAETIRYLRLSQSTLYMRLDQFETVRMGRRIYVTRASADAFIAANTHAPTRPMAPPKRRRRADDGELRP
jgi:hypothetical protein